jgi:hypothetical protein
MSQACNNINAIKSKLFLCPEVVCGEINPVIHRVTLSAPASTGSSTLTLTLDTSFTPSSGAYTTLSSFTLVAGVTLYFVGGAVKVVNDPQGKDFYTITTAPTTIRVLPISQPLGIGDISTTYFAFPICLTSHNFIANNSQTDNTINSSSLLLTPQFTGYSRLLDLAGNCQAKNSGYNFQRQAGRKLKVCHFFLDHGGVFFTGGKLQLGLIADIASPSKDILRWRQTGLIQSITLETDEYLTTLALSTLQGTVTLWGGKSVL